MGYTKPEVLHLGQATVVVQMQEKGEGDVDNPDPITLSGAAYEADE